MMDWYVYIYFQPWDGQPCYVGKGKGNRWLKHEQAGVNHRNPFFAEVFATAHTMGMSLIRIKAREYLSEDEAFTIEVALIRTIGRLGLGTGPLVNLTDGGGRYVWTRTNGINKKETFCFFDGARCF